MTFDVSMRLRMINDLSKEAPKVERDLKDLADAAKKLGTASGGDRLEKQIRDIGREAERSERQIERMGWKMQSTGGRMEALYGRFNRFGKLDIMPNVGKKLDDIERPAGRLDRTMGSLVGVATGAFGALMAFASVDNIVRGLERLSEQYQKLNRDVASVAVTAEMRTPEAITRISKSNERLSIRYGLDQSSVNAARKTYAAAGIDLDSQEAVLDPSLKAAKAEDSTGETIASAVIAAKQNLGVKDSEISAALDMMAKGAKLGSFEVDAMAKNFPSLATMLAGTGREGLGGWGELIALAQVVRTGAGSQDEAATNLRNLLSKVSSRDTVENFSKKGVDLSKLKARAEQEGTPYLTAVMDEVMRLTNGDEFKINELFGDQQAGLALKPLLSKRDLYESFLKQIMEESGGTVDADFDFLRSLPQERADRRRAATTATGDKIGQAYNALTGPLRDTAAGIVNPDYATQEEAYRKDQLRRLGPVELSRRIADIDANLSKLPPEFLDGFMPSMQLFRGGLKGSRQELQDALDRFDSKSSLEARDERAASQGPGAWKRFMLGDAAEPGFRLKDKLGVDLRPAAEQSMQGYNEALAAEGERAASEAQSIADRIKAMLGFTVSPTIAPTLAPAASAPAGGDKHSSLSQSSNVRLTQNIVSPNPRHAALRSQREQDRAIRQARARSLHDTGRSLA